MGELEFNVRSLLFGKYHNIYYNTLEILTKNSDFQQFLRKNNEKEAKHKSFTLLKKYIQLINLNYSDYMLDTRRFSIYSDVLFSFDNATGIRLGVDFDLYLRTLLNFGTNKHLLHIKKLFNFSEFGCFALGELAHGSNTKEIQTTAIFDSSKDEFIVNTTNERGIKFWIGSAFQIANMAVVFAKLIIEEVDYGIHAFIVPIRNKYTHNLMQGIYIGDCGKKIGNNNKDDGFIIFRNVRIPRDNLLDRYSKVSAKGDYQSQMKNQGERFGFLIGTIMNEARIMVCNRTIINLLKAIFISKDFFKSNTNKNNKFNYINIVSETIIYKIVGKRLYDHYDACKGILLDYHNKKIIELHAFISVLKPLTTWFSSLNIQKLIEITKNFKLLNLYNDNNVNVVWEGDNYVLLQQGARYILDRYRLIKTKNFKENNTDILNFIKKDNVLRGGIDFIKEKYDFLNENFLIKIFEKRLAHFILKSENELNKNIDKFHNIFAAWNHSQVFFLKNMTVSFGELYILNEIIQELNSIDKGQSKILKNMIVLWALSIILEKIDEFIFFLTPKNIIFIKELSEELKQELELNIFKIIDNIQFPDSLIYNDLILGKL